jgi:hypothetical protein
VTRKSDAVTEIEIVCRYLRALGPVIASLEAVGGRLAVDDAGGSLAVVAGLAVLLRERALGAYDAVRAVRGLGPLPGAMPDPDFVRSLVARFEPDRGERP